MEGYQGLSREWMEQIALLSSIIGGFSVAIAVELLVGERKQRITPALIVIFVLTASMLLISTSVSSQVVIKMDVVQSMQFNDIPEFLRENLPVAATISAAVYYIGLGLFILGLGLSGWLHSKTVGLITTSTAAFSGIVIAVLVILIR